MVYFILIWGILTLSCLAIGTALLNGVKADGYDRRGDYFITAVWLGLIVLAICLLATSFAVPLSPLLGGAIALSLGILSGMRSPTRRRIFNFLSTLSAPEILAYSLSSLLVAALMTRQVEWSETAAYHASSIRWLSEFGAVPGIALIYRPLGITSSWFALAATFSGQIFGYGAMVFVNGFALLIALIQFLFSLAHIWRGKSQLSDWFFATFFSIFLCLLAVLTTLQLIAVSPSPDLPIIMLTAVVGWSILIIDERRKPDKIKVNPSTRNMKIIPLLLSVGAVAIKLSALPLLFVACFIYGLDKPLNIRQLLPGFFAVTLLLLPVFSFGIVVSGCPAFPSSLLCLDLPWTETKQEIERFAGETHGWGSWYGAPPPGSNEFLWQVGQWLSDQRLNQLMAFLGGVSIFSSIYIVRKTIRERAYARLWLVILGGVGMTFILLKGPLLRLGLGYFLLFPALAIATWCQIQLDNQKLLVLWQQLVARLRFKSWRKFLVVGSACSGALTIALYSLELPNLQSRLLLPPPLPFVQLAQKQINDITYFSPIDNNCWAAKLPCTPKDLPPTLRLLHPDQGIGGGFKKEQL